MVDNLYTISLTFTQQDKWKMSSLPEKSNRKQASDKERVADDHHLLETALLSCVTFRSCPFLLLLLLFFFIFILSQQPHPFSFTMVSSFAMEDCLVNGALRITRSTPIVSGPCNASPGRCCRGIELHVLPFTLAPSWWTNVRYSGRTWSVPS